MYLLPKPHNIELLEEYFILKYDTEIILDSKLSLKELKYAKILQSEIEETLGFSLPIIKAKESNSSSIYLNICKELKAEEYKLFIKKDGIEIEGGDSESLLYGIQTLRQIIISEGAVLNCLTIYDYPEISNRGFYHDATRGRIPTLKTLKALADKMSFYKLNQLQLYVEHSFLFKNFSEVWRDDSPLTGEEIMELDLYCKELNIELVPSIASFGHLYKVLCTKTYNNLCELENSDKEEFSFVGRMEHHTVDITNEKSLELIQNMLMEYMPFFSSDQFNICADETFDLGKGKSKEMADEVGMDAMYVDFLNKVCCFVQELGKRPMFWGDIILSKPEAIKKLPEEVICLNWDYNTDVTEDNIKKLYDLGVTQYVCPGVHGWNHLINRLDHGYDNIMAMCKYAIKYHAAGVLNTDWGDFGHINHPEFSIPGMIYGASFSWNSEPISFKEINKEISLLEYKDQSESFVEIVHEISSKDDTIWSGLIYYKEKRVSLIPKEMIDNAVSANVDIFLAIEKLYKVMSNMDTSRRNVVKAYLIMAEGMILFNRVLIVIGQYLLKEDKLSVQPNKLAVDLEYWFKDYKELWRSMSKEGELYRIQEVIFWYADLLRNIR